MHFPSFVLFQNHKMLEFYIYFRQVYVFQKCYLILLIVCFRNISIGVIIMYQHHIKVLCDTLLTLNELISILFQRVFEVYLASDTKISIKVDIMSHIVLQSHAIVLIQRLIKISSLIFAICHSAVMRYLMFKRQSVLDLTSKPPD